MKEKSHYMRLNWAKIISVQKDILDIQGDQAAIAISIIRNGKTKKYLVQSKDIIVFLWQMTENLNANALILQDAAGNILYKHSGINGSNEEVQLVNDSNIIDRWKDLKQQEKDILLNLIISQINAYES